MGSSIISMKKELCMLSALPDANGHFGQYGGSFVPETLMHALEELKAAYAEARADESFQREFDTLLREYVGRQTPITFAERLTRHLGGARIFMKPEDLNSGVERAPGRKDVSKLQTPRYRMKQRR